MGDRHPIPNPRALELLALQQHPEKPLGVETVLLLGQEPGQAISARPSRLLRDARSRMTASCTRMSMIFMATSRSEAG
jgi:hypothetical protein